MTDNDYLVLCVRGRATYSNYTTLHWYFKTYNCWRQKLIYFQDLINKLVWVETMEFESLKLNSQDTI